MQEATIAVVQMSPKLGQVEDNLARMGQFVGEICRAQKVNLIVFPELATTGYECGMKFADLAERVSGHVVNVMAKHAADFDTHIVFGMVETQKLESVIYNAAVVVGPEGEVIGGYHKVHLKGEEKLIFRSGFRYPVLETDFGTIGILIGWDLAFPEAARSLALLGAEILCVPANWERPHTEEWRSYLFARAFENSCFIAAANRVGEEYTYSFFGESMIIGPRGEIYGQVGEDIEGYTVSKIDLDAIKKNREEFGLLQSRQPRTYREVVRMY